jgi:hypothetical protein
VPSAVMKHADDWSDPSSVGVAVPGVYLKYLISASVQHVRCSVLHTDCSEDDNRGAWPATGIGGRFYALADIDEVA